ncbi:MAG: adenosylcobinamide-GDP ribazoletransferase [Pseudomonadota bacterium]
MKSLPLALAFLTRLPVPAVDPDPLAMGRSLAWYPLVGALIGALLAGAAALLVTCLPAAPGVTAVLIVAFWAWLTGGLHLDGLADTADAAAAGGDRTRRLAVLQDPRAGPAGVVAVVLVLLAKYAALTQLLQAGAAITALVIAPVIGRSLVVAAFLTTPYVRAGGLGEALARHHDRRACLTGLALTVIGLGVLAGPAAALVLVLSNAALLLYWRRSALRDLGGCTGDLAGALVEVGEILTLLGCMAVLAPSVR